MSNFVTHLECSKAGDCYDHEEINNLSKINKPLFVKYDLERLKIVIQEKISLMIFHPFLDFGSISICFHLKIKARLLIWEK